MDEIEGNAPPYDEWPAEVLAWRYLRAINDPTHSHADIACMHETIEAHPDRLKEWVYDRLGSDEKRGYMRFLLRRIK